MQRVLALVVVLAAWLAFVTESRGEGRPSRHESLTSGLDCSACHTTAGWRLMEGSGAGQGFDHARTGFPLTGRHRDAGCTGCHQGGMRSLSRTCASCHDDAHRGRLGQACDRCHSATGWARTDAFARHRMTRLPLSGMHALADCTECHRQTTDRFLRNVPANCFSCHANEYRRQDIHPLHTGVPGDPSRPPFSQDCAQCHRATGWVPAVVTDTAFGTARAALVAPVTHEAVFPLRTGKHRGTACDSCHADARSPRLVRCDGCHVHAPTQIAAQHRTPVSLAVTACLACHPGGARR